MIRCRSFIAFSTTTYQEEVSASKFELVYDWYILKESRPTGGYTIVVGLRESFRVLIVGSGDYSNLSSQRYKMRVDHRWAFEVRLDESFLRRLGNRVADLRVSAV